MSYFIFIKNVPNERFTLYRIAENNSDLNNLNIDQSSYNIIEVTQDIFNLIKFESKHVIGYDNNNNILYKDISKDVPTAFVNKQQLQTFITDSKKVIQNFLINNLNHPLYNRWNSYYNQLNNLNLDSITYPLNKSLEQYFNDLGQPSFNILQLP